MKHYNNNSGYSIVISLLMVGFLIVVTSGVFNLVLGELNDNRGRENYLKAFAGAEGALELALLQVKENGYGYYGDSALLLKDPSDPKSNLLKSETIFKGNKDPVISYNLDSKTNSHSGSLDPLGYAIVPLFVIGDSVSPNTEGPITTVSDINVLGSGLDSLVWNILGEEDGISGTDGFVNTHSVDNAQVRDFTTVSEYQFIPITVGDFLSESNRQDKPIYLILFNSSPSQAIEYEASSTGDFTRPETIITSSAQVGKYKQNLSTTLDNTQFLNILRYSIYSN